MEHLFPQLPPSKSPQVCCVPSKRSQPQLGGPLHVLVPIPSPCPAIVGPWLLQQPSLVIYLAHTFIKSPRTKLSLVTQLDQPYVFCWDLSGTIPKGKMKQLNKEWEGKETEGTLFFLCPFSINLIYKALASSYTLNILLFVCLCWRGILSRER